MHSYYDRLKTSFLDELEKIAGTGQSRIGKRPISADVLLKNSKKIKKLGNMVKVSNSAERTIAGIGAAAGLYGAYKANQFYRNTKRKLQNQAAYQYESL